MAESTQYMFDHKEVVEALVKKQDLHEGLWQLAVSFDMAAVNIGASTDQVSPAAVIRLTKLGLTRTDKESSISVDAAKVNPQNGRKKKFKK